MRFLRALVALGLLVSVTRGGEVSLLKGDVLKGDVISVSDKEIVLKQGDKRVTKPIAEVVKIDFRDPGKPPTGKRFSQVRLTDGTTVLVSKWLLKNKVMELVLLAGPVVKVPLATVANVLNSAQDEKFRREWESRTFNTRGKEAIVILNKAGRPNNIECTLGETDEKGESITVATVLRGKVVTAQRELSGLHGIIFKNSLDPKAAVPVCKLLDTIQDVVMVTGITPRDGGVIVTTPSKAQLDFSYEQIARLDYAKGKLDFLSDLEPSSREIKPNPFDTGEARDRWFVYKDANLSNKRIRLGGVTYNKGLTLLPEVELTYDLKGEYREFSATVGIDEETRAEGEVTLVIEGDNKELASIPIVYRTEKTKTGEARKPPRPIKLINLNIKDVQRLKVILKAKDELNGLSMSVSLGNAKVNK